MSGTRHPTKFMIEPKKRTVKADDNKGCARIDEKNATFLNCGDLIDPDCGRIPLYDR